MHIKLHIESSRPPGLRVTCQANTGMKTDIFAIAMCSTICSHFFCITFRCSHVQVSPPKLSLPPKDEKIAAAGEGGRGEIRLLMKFTTP